MRSALHPDSEQKGRSALGARCDGARGGMHMSTAPRKGTKRKALLDLERNDCRWPIGEPKHPDFHFCGRPRAPDRPYCALHWAMAFQPPRPRHQTPAAIQPPTAMPSRTAKAA